MGIAANRYGIDISKTNASIKKIIINIDMDKKIKKEDRKLLEKLARAFPVSKSLHPDLIKIIDFEYS